MRSKKSNILIVCLISLLFCLNSFIFTNISGKNDNFYTSIDDLDYTSIRITNITYGRNINVVLKNTGDLIASDVSLDIYATGGFLLNIPNPNFKFSSILPGESIEQEIKLFGIGLEFFMSYLRFLYRLQV